MWFYILTMNCEKEKFASAGKWIKYLKVNVTRGWKTCPWKTGVTGKFGSRVQNEARQSLTEFCQENAWSKQIPSSNNARDDSTCGHHQMSIPKSDWLYSLQPKMENIYTVSRNKTGSWLWIRSWHLYCKIQTLIEESRENHWTIQVWPKSHPLMIIQWKWQIDSRD